jgi:anaerobic magnesium-protoporphyrin IX monomethyl ester cyclase
VDGITPEMARLTKETGCSAMGLGVESVSQDALDLVNKNIKISDARETIRLPKHNNIECRIYMIMGLSGEPLDIVPKTLEFLKETGPDLVTLSLFTARPGTEVYNNPKKFGIKHLETKWGNTMHMHGECDREMIPLTFEFEK